MLTPQPGTDQRFGAWTDACDTAGGVCVLDMTADLLVGAGFVSEEDGVTVILAGTGSGTVRSVPAIDCPGDCAEVLPRGSMVTLTAAAATGSDFLGWSGDCAGATSTCDLTITSPRVAVASFGLREYPLEVSRSGTGLGTVTADTGTITCGSTCDDRYGHGTMVTLTATADVSSTFTGWPGACTGAATTCVVTMTAARSVVAEFDARRFDVTVVPGGTGSGTVTSVPTGISCGYDCTENVTYGTVVTLTAAAAASSTWGGWGGACAAAGMSSTCMLTITADTTADATFTLRSHGVTVVVDALGGGGGAVTSAPVGITCGADCSETWSHGTMVSLTATPATGSDFVGWSDDCAGHSMT